MAKGHMLRLFTPVYGYFLDGNKSHHWDVFMDPCQRKTYEPENYKRVLWSVTPTTRLDGQYYGDSVIKGYEVLREVVKNGNSDVS